MILGHFAKKATQAIFNIWLKIKTVINRVAQYILRQWGRGLKIVGKNVFEKKSGIVHNEPMPITSKVEKIKDDTGVEKDAFVVSFTNGAKEQISDLRIHFGQTDELELIKLGISLLQRVKENEVKAKETTK